MRRDLLEHGIAVIDHLETSGVADALVPDEARDRFEMNCCWRENHPNFDDLIMACPGGYFLYDPTFNEAGLHNQQDDDPKVAHVEPYFQGKTGFEALQAFFEITDDQASHMFGGGHTSLFDHARERIQDVLDDLPPALLREKASAQQRQLSLLLEQISPQSYGAEAWDTP